MRPRTDSERRQPRRSRLVAVALGLLVVACSTTSPPTHFHTLMPGEVVTAAAGPPRVATTIVLEPVRLPAQVDQPQWVVRLPDDSLAVLEQERWASPLRDEFHGALLEQLIVAHGAVDARTQPAPSQQAFRIALDVRRFDSLPGREARIEGSWTIQGGASRAASRCEWRLREPAPGSVGALAAAHRKQIARLGDAIAAALARMARGEPASCPALDDPR